MYGFVYITTNHVNGKQYIGQRKYDKQGKWKEYLGSGIILSRAIEKYGLENFSKEIIEECKTKKILNDREIYWINYYNAVESDNFYNIASGGDGGNTIAGYTDDQRNLLSTKLSNMRKGIVNIGKNNGNSRRVICINTMKVFDTINEASIYYNVDKDAIQQCCSDANKRKTAGEIHGERMIWEYYDENKNYEFVPFKRDYKYKQILCLDNNIIYNSVHEASKNTGCSIVGIRHCCTGYLKTTKGMHFSYV